MLPLRKTVEEHPDLAWLSSAYFSNLWVSRLKTSGDLLAVPFTLQPIIEMAWFTLGEIVLSAYILGYSRTDVELRASFCPEKVEKLTNRS